MNGKPHHPELRPILIDLYALFEADGMLVSQIPWCLVSQIWAGCLNRQARNIGFIILAGTSLAGCGGSSGSPPPPPSEAVVITTEPQNQVVPIGETATFTVAATGTPPLSYQWSQNGQPISGATSASYTTLAVALGPGGSTSLGSFQVTVSNASSSAQSNSASLTAVARAPKQGDLRYLLFEQVTLPGLCNNEGGMNFWGGAEDSSAYYDNAVGGPLLMGNGADCNSTACTWLYWVFGLPAPMTGLNMYFQGGNYSTFYSDLASYAASNVVFTSLDLEAEQNAYGLAWVQTTGAGGFDYRVDPPVPPGADQQAGIQAQVAADGNASRIATAVSFDSSGNAVLISYGWQGDTTTVYDAQAVIVPPGAVPAAAANLAGEGYFISAFGGNDTDNYILIGMRVHGDTLARQIGQNLTTGPPYPTFVVRLDEPGVQTDLSEQ